MRDLPAFVVPLFVVFFQIAGTLGSNARINEESREHLYTAVDPFALALVIIGPVALLARRRYPVETMLVASVVTTLYFLRAYPPGPVPLAFSIAFIAAVAAGHRFITWLIGGLAISSYLMIAALVGRDSGSAVTDATGLFPAERPGPGGITMLLAISLAIAAVAEVVRIRGERAAEAQRTREEEVRRQAGEERLRIARELHDVLAHNIAMINVQSGVALHLMDDNPEQARTALAAIKEASKEALTEVRSVLGMLRQADEEADAPRTPVTGLDRLDDLVERARIAGLRARSEVTGTPEPLPAAVDRAAFRIVQEALTNATKYAGTGASVTVSVVYGDDELRLRIRNDGRGQPEAPAAVEGGGNGIVGMRERAAALGGELTAEPVTGGGFQVRCRLPITRETE